MAAGDDISDANRCDVSVDILNQHPRAAEVMLSAKLIDVNGNLTGAKTLAPIQAKLQTVEHLERCQFVTLGATRAIRKRAFDDFGPLLTSCPTEDTPLMLRSMLSGGSIVSNVSAVKYRIHPSNLSSPTSLAGIDARSIHSQYEVDLKCAMARGHLAKPEDRAVRRWIKQDVLIRKIRGRRAMRKPLSFSDAVSSLFTRAFSMREKLITVAYSLGYRSVR
jgi:hypothetical protein